MQGKMTMQREKKVLKKDLELLYQLYKYRVLSTSQIMQIRGISRWYVHEKITELRNRGFIHTEAIVGNYLPNQRRQGNCHRISGKGISLLKDYGYDIQYTADDLKVAKQRLAYLLVANELAIELKEYGWEYKDSREVKNFMNLNRGDMFQGLLINPDKTREYALYVFLKKVQANTLERIKQEIERSPFEDILIIARGESSIESVLTAFKTVIKAGSVKVLPFRFAQMYLNNSNDNKRNHIAFLNSLGIEVLDDSPNKNVFEVNVSFDYIVRYNGEIMYFVDLLDNDLMKIHEIRRYRKESYERYKRKVMALTSPIKAHIEFHKQMLGNPSHIQYHVIDPNRIVEFAVALPNKNVFENR